MENIEVKKIDPKQKKISDMFARKPAKVENAVESPMSTSMKGIDVQAEPEVIIDLTDVCPIDENTNKLTEQVNKLIEIKQEDGTQFTAMLGQLLKKEKKYKPGPKFAKLEKKLRKKANEEANKSSNSSEASSLISPEKIITAAKEPMEAEEAKEKCLDSPQANSTAINSDAMLEDEENLLMPLDNVRQRNTRKRRTFEKSPDEPRSTRQKSRHEEEKMAQIIAVKEENELNLTFQSNATLEVPEIEPKNAQESLIEAAQVPETPNNALVTQQPIKIVSVTSLVHDSSKTTTSIAEQSAILKKKIIEFNRLTKAFKCMSVDCLFSTSKIDEMKEHTLKHKGAPGSLKCAACLLESIDAEALEKHLIETHKKDIFQCKKCFYLAKDLVSITKHREEKHSEAEKNDLYSLIIQRI